MARKFISPEGEIFEIEEGEEEAARRVGLKPEDEQSTMDGLLKAGKAWGTGFGEQIAFDLDDELAGGLRTGYQTLAGGRKKGQSFGDLYDQEKAAYNSAKDRLKEGDQENYALGRDAGELTSYGLNPLRLGFKGFGRLAKAAGSAMEGSESAADVTRNAVTKGEGSPSFYGGVGLAALRGGHKIGARNEKFIDTAKIKDSVEKTKEAGKNLKDSFQKYKNRDKSIDEFFDSNPNPNLVKQAVPKQAAPKGSSGSSWKNVRSAFDDVDLSQGAKPEHINQARVLRAKDKAETIARAGKGVARAGKGVVTEVADDMKAFKSSMKNDPSFRNNMLLLAAASGIKPSVFVPLVARNIARGYIGTKAIKGIAKGQVKTIDDLLKKSKNARDFVDFKDFQKQYKGLEGLPEWSLKKGDVKLPGKKLTNRTNEEKAYDFLKYRSNREKLRDIAGKPGSKKSSATMEPLVPSFRAMIENSWKKDLNRGINPKKARAIQQEQNYNIKKAVERGLNPEIAKVIFGNK